MKNIDLLRVMNEIDDEYVEEAMPFAYKEKKQFKIFKYIPLFFCLILAFMGIKLINKDVKNTMIANPIVFYQTKEEAENNIGFDFNVDLSGFNDLTYSVIDNEILEIAYNNGDDYLICRKSKGSDDNSGDYNMYDVVFNDMVDDVDVLVKQENNKILLTFEDDTYSYSFSSNCLSEEEMFEIVKTMLK